MSDWNPHASAVVGLQWPASRMIDTSLVSGTGATAIIDVKTTETVDRVRMFMGATADEKSAFFDIYDAANGDHGDARCYLTVPNTVQFQTLGWHAKDATTGFGFNTQSGPQTNLWSYIDDKLDVNDPWSDATADWIRNAPTVAESQTGGYAGFWPFLRMQLNPSLVTIEDDSVAAPAGTPISGTDRVIMIEPWALVDYVNSGHEQRIAMFLELPNYAQAGVTDRVLGPYKSYYGPTGLHQISWRYSYRQDTPNGPAFVDLARPGTHEPLTVADWQKICAGGAGYLILQTGPVYGATIPGAGDPGNGAYPELADRLSGFHIYAVGVNLWVVGEKRVATGKITVRAAETSKWYNAPTKNPSTYANAPFTKTAAHTYYTVVRDQQTGGGDISWRSMDCGNTAGHEGDLAPFLRSSSVPFVPAFAGSGLFGERLPPFAPETPAYALTLSSGLANRVDGSQPYVELKEIGLWNPSHFLLQEFGTAHAAVGYGMARVMILNWGGMRGPLTVALTRTGFISTYASETIAPEDLEPTDVAWQVHDVELDPTVPLVLGQEAQLVCVPSAQAAFGPWILGALSTREDLQFNNVTTMGDLTFQSTFGLARYLQQPPGGGPVEDSTGINWIDAPFQILRQPDPLTGFLAGPLAQGTLPQTSGDCSVSNIPYVGMSWIPSALGSAWTRYEVERFNPNSGLWDRIGELSGDEVDAAFSDFEIPAGVEQGYRVRVRNNLGVPSAWTTILPSVQVFHQPWVLYLVSNVNPTRNVAYQYETPEEWVDVDGESLVVRKLFGRDKHIAFKPTEERGLRFSKSLIVAANDPAVTDGTVVSGPAIFDRLRAICRDPLLPYVAVIDHHGNRWFTAPRFVKGTRENPGERHLAQVEFVEVATKAFPSPIVWNDSP